jgi:hypothetical protein
MRVYHIERPCDLLVRFWCNRHQTFCWQTLEVKAPNKDGTPKRRRDQPAQQEFLRETGTPIVTDFDSALVELNKIHRLAGVTTDSTLKMIPA